MAFGKIENKHKITETKNECKINQIDQKLINGVTGAVIPL